MRVSIHSSDRPFSSRRDQARGPDGTWLCARWDGFGGWIGRACNRMDGVESVVSCQSGRSFSGSAILRPSPQSSGRGQPIAPTTAARARPGHHEGDYGGSNGALTSRKPQHRLGVGRCQGPNSGADEFRPANGHSTERLSGRRDAGRCWRRGRCRVRSTILVHTNWSRPTGWAGLVNSSPDFVAAFGARRRPLPEGCYTKASRRRVSALAACRRRAPGGPGSRLGDESDASISPELPRTEDRTRHLFHASWISPRVNRSHPPDPVPRYQADQIKRTPDRSGLDRV